MSKISRRFAAVLSFVFLFSALCVVSAQEEKPKWEPPKLEQEGGWTMVVLPDPQQYTSTHNIPILEMMMNWVVESKESLNTQNLIAVGDFVNNNSKEKQWKLISHAFSILDGKVPYFACTGNHDYGTGKPTANTRETNMNKYFKPDRNPLWDGVLTEMGPNALAGEKTLENAAFVQTINGKKVITILLQCAPKDEQVQWAKEFCDRPENQDAFVVVVTHFYMLPCKRDNQIDDGRHYILLKEDGGNTGLDLWNKLISTTPNIRLVLCGHHSGTDDPADCTGFRVDKNNAGKNVYQMIYDAQALGGGFGGNGGDGWLRILEFSADMTHVKAKTFSPLFAISPSTQEMSIDKADYNCFEFDIE